MLSDLMYAVAYARGFFLLKDEYSIDAYVMFYLSIYVSINRHLGWFHLLAVVNGTAMDMDPQRSPIIYPEVKLMDHMLILFQFFEECIYFE